MSNDTPTRQDFDYALEPLVELNCRLANLRRRGFLVGLGFGRVDDEPNCVKVYLDGDWVLLDMACEVNDLQWPRPGETFTSRPQPQLGPEPLSLGVLYLIDGEQPERTVTV